MDMGRDVDRMLAELPVDEDAFTDLGKKQTPRVSISLVDVCVCKIAWPVLPASFSSWSPYFPRRCRRSL